MSCCRKYKESSIINYFHIHEIPLSKQFIYMFLPHTLLFSPEKCQGRFKQCSALTRHSSPVPNPNYAVIFPSPIFKGKFSSGNICFKCCTPFGQPSPATGKLNVESREGSPCSPFDALNAKILMGFGGGKCGLEARQGDFDLCSCSGLNT